MKYIHLLVAIVLVSWLGSTARAQSLADLARQERERKKAMSGKTVLTINSETPHQGSQPDNVTVQPPATETAKNGETKATTTTITDSKGRDEKYWRSTFERARQELKRAEGKLTLLDLKMNDLQSSLYRESIYSREQEIRQNITATEKDQALARDEVAAAQKKISDLEDELRRSGGPPGWAR